MALQAVFEDFKRNKEALRAIHEDTVECFNKIQESLLCERHGRELATQLVKDMTMTPGPRPADVSGDAFVDVSALAIGIEGKDCSISSLADTLYTREEREEVSKLFVEESCPSLIVIGQTNSGKSSIVNEILGCKIVSTSDQPCTSRIVKMTYSKENYVELITQDGEKVLEKIKSEKASKIPRELIELKQEDRENPERVTAIVKAGFDIPFLESGVDIIDSPGRNENPVLDDLVRKQLDSILPFIVYVIDGHNLFTAQDHDVLREIRKKHGEIEIFFVVSKIEPKESDSSDEEDEDDEEDAGQTETVQENKKRRVFEQLVKNGHLSPEKDMHSDECFHGLSAWKLYEYRRKIKRNPQWKDPNGVYKEYTDAFDRFQSSLRSFAESCLKGSIKTACEKLTRVLSRCLYLFIERANSIKQNRDATLSMLKKIDEDVSILNENVLRQIQKQKEEIKDVMDCHFKALEEDVQETAKSFRYSEEYVVLAKDGYVSGAEAVNQCRTQIEQIVFNKVQEEIKSTLMAMFRTRDDFLEGLIAKMKKIEEEALSEEVNSSSASATLYSTLVVCFEPDVQCKTEGWSFRRMSKQFAELVKRFFTRPVVTVKGKVKVGDPQWKAKTALDTLHAIDVTSIGEDVVKTLNRHFATCYDKFKVELLNMANVLVKGETLKDDQRKAILKFAPDVASLEMLCHSINDLIKYGRPQKGETISAGAQGHVFECTNIKTDQGKPCAVKVVPIPSDGSLKDLTLELHTSREFNHPNILPVVCTIIEPVLSGITVSIVSERMRSDLHHALPTITSLRARLNILLDVALALQYLHKKGLMHRDIKLQNVLVDENNKGYLTDFGLCKPEGLAGGSLVGTPMAMAPEMISQRYDKSVDVYAFGVMMWRVCEGTGKQPANIFLFPVPIVMLVVNAKDNRKPERLEKFSPSCWALMEKCWLTDPDLRPSFDDIVQDLKDILADKSIT